MDWAFLAVEDQVERIFLTLEFIRNEIIGLSSVQLRYQMINISLAHLLAIPDVQPVLEQSLFFRQHSCHLKVSNNQGVS
jgi:hypothetical protein